MTRKIIASRDSVFYVVYNGWNKPEVVEAGPRQFVPMLAIPHPFATRAEAIKAKEKLYEQERDNR